MGETLYDPRDNSTTIGGQGTPPPDYDPRDDKTPSPLSASYTKVPSNEHGKGVQMSSATGPVAESMGTPIEEGRSSPGVLAAGSMASDPEQRRRIVAARLFPDLPPLQAQSRVFPGVNGRLAAVGPDGKAFYVDPTPYAPDVNQPRSLVPTQPLDRAASLTGPALPAGAALVGGMAAGPTSLVAGPVAAGVGAAAGDAVRQSIAQELDPGVPDPKGGRIWFPTTTGNRPAPRRSAPRLASCSAPGSHAACGLTPWVRVNMISERCAIRLFNSGSPTATLVLVPRM